MEAEPVPRTLGRDPLAQGSWKGILLPENGLTHHF